MFAIKLTCAIPFSLPAQSLWVSNFVSVSVQSNCMCMLSKSHDSHEQLHKENECGDAVLIRCEAEYAGLIGGGGE